MNVSSCQFSLKLKYVVELLFQLRHEILIVNDLGECKFGSDADLTMYGLNRTPDHFQIDGSNIILTEYTISNDLDKTIFQKGGFELLKYSNEKRVLEGLGYNCELKLKYYITGESPDTNCNLFVDSKIRFQKTCNNISSLGSYKLQSCDVSLPNYMFANVEKLKGEILQSTFLTNQIVVDNNAGSISFNLPKNFVTIVKENKLELLATLSSIISYQKHSLVNLNFNKTIKIVLSTAHGMRSDKLLECLNNDDYWGLKDFIMINGKQYQPDITDPIFYRSLVVKEKRFEGEEFNLVGNFQVNEVPMILPRFNDINLLQTDVVQEILHVRAFRQNLLTTNIVSNESIANSIKLANEKFVELNTLGQKDIFRIKPITTFPMVTPEALIPGEFNDFLLIMDVVSDSFVVKKALLNIKNKTLKTGFSRIFDKNLKKDLYSVNTKIGTIIQDIVSSGLKPTKENFKTPEIVKLNKERKLLLNKYKNLEKTPNNNLYFTLNNDELKHFNEIELSSWESDREFTKKCGVNVVEDHFGFLNNFANYLLTGVNQNLTNKNLFEIEFEDINVFKALTSDSLSSYNTFFKSIRNKRFLGMAEFISKLCYELLFLSQTTNNGKEFMVHNLGFKNVLLIVRGGSKIFRTRRSRLFKLLVPIDSELYELMTLNNNEHSFERVDGFVITPWMDLKEVEIHHGISFFHNIFSYYYSTCEKMLTDSGSIDELTAIFPVILALNGKRKTEKALHNLRYPIVNCLGTFSKITDILPSLLFCAKDHLQICLQKSFLDRYCDFAKNVRKFIDVPHLFLNTKLRTETELTTLIYSTYLMTKAPIDSTIEQVKNLSGIMENLDAFEAVNHGGENFVRAQSYDISVGISKGVMDSNFMYSSKMSYLCGTKLAEVIKQNHKHVDISNVWARKIKGSLVDLSGPTGCRYKGKTFFGQKGSFVLAQDLLLSIKKEHVKELVDIIQRDDKDELNFFCKTHNITIESELYNGEEEKFKFHVVYKLQRAGEREIFAMDFYTKTNQKIFDEMWGMMCEMFPNEYIHIPSNLRSQQIHSFVNDRKHLDHVLWCTLDDTKFAPRTNMNKYVMFILGAAHALPESFVNYSLSFLYKYYSKEIHLNKTVYHAFMSNKRFQKYNTRFKYDEEQDSFMFLMEFSFVMGILNKLSTLFKVCAILVLNDLAPKCLKELNLDPNVHIHILNHSDDAGGTCESQTLESLLPTLEIYEVGQSLANHNLSNKKSVIIQQETKLSTKSGPVYFEFLSVLYINGRLLPLTTKFMSNLEFEPSLKGLPSDLMKAVNKGLEIIFQGGSFKEAFLKKFLYSSLVCGIYKIKPNGNYPIQLGGFPMSHPLMDMISGSCADVIRLYKCDKERLLKMIHILHFSQTEIIVDKIPFLTTKTYLIENDKVSDLHESLATLLKPLLEVFDMTQPNVLNLLVMSGCKNPFIFLTNLCEQLKSSDFLSSLNNESDARLISRVIEFSKTNSFSMANVTFRPREMHQHVEELIDYLDTGVYITELHNLSLHATGLEIKLSNIETDLNFMFENVLDFYERMSTVDAEGLRFESHVTTVKPISFYYRNNSTTLVLKSSIYKILLDNYFPTLCQFTPTTYDTKKEFELITKMCKTNEPDRLCMLAQKYTKYSNKSFNCYGQVDTSDRIIDDNFKMLKYLTQNQSYHKLVKGLRYQKLRFLNKEDHFSDQFKLLSEFKTFKLIENYLDENFEEPSIHFQDKTILYKNLLTELSEEVPVFNLLTNFQRMCEEGTPLESCFFFFWTKKQLRIGDSWVGSQVIHAKIFKHKLVFVQKDSELFIDIPNPYSGAFDSLESQLIQSIMIKFFRNSAMRSSKNTKNYVLGVHDATQCLGIYREDETTLCFDSGFSQRDFDEKIINHKFDKDKLTYYDKTTNKATKLYDISELVSYSTVLKNFFKLKAGAKPSKKFLECIDILVKADLTDIKLEPDFLYKNFSGTNISYALNVVLPDDFDIDVLNPEILKIFCDKLISKDLATKVDNKYYNTLMKLNVDPKTVPSSIRDIYVKKMFIKYLNDNYSEFIDDFVTLFKKFDEDGHRYFCQKWGSEGEKYMLELYERKSLTALNSFNYDTSGFNLTVLSGLLEILTKTYEQSSSFGSFKVDFMLIFTASTITTNFERNLPMIELQRMLFEILNNNDSLKIMVSLLDSSSNPMLRKFVVDSGRFNFICSYLMSGSRFLSNKNAILRNLSYKECFVRFQNIRKNMIKNYNDNYLTSSIVKLFNYSEMFIDLGFANPLEVISPSQTKFFEETNDFAIFKCEDYWLNEELMDSDLETFIETCESEDIEFELINLTDVKNVTTKIVVRYCNFFDPDLCYSQVCISPILINSTMLNKSCMSYIEQNKLKVFRSYEKGIPMFHFLFGKKKFLNSVNVKNMNWFECTNSIKHYLNMDYYYYHKDPSKDYTMSDDMDTIKVLVSVKNNAKCLELLNEKVLDKETFSVILCECLINKGLEKVLIDQSDLDFIKIFEMYKSTQRENKDSITNALYSLRYKSISLLQALKMIKLNDLKPLKNNTNEEFELLPKKLNLTGFINQFGHTTPLGRELGALLGKKVTQLNTNILEVTNAELRGLQTVYKTGLDLLNRIDQNTADYSNVYYLTTFINMILSVAVANDNEQDSFGVTLWGIMDFFQVIGQSPPKVKHKPPVTQKVDIVEAFFESLL